MPNPNLQLYGQICSQIATIIQHKLHYSEQFQQPKISAKISLINYSEKSKKSKNE